MSNSINTIEIAKLILTLTTYLFIYLVVPKTNVILFIVLAVIVPFSTYVIMSKLVDPQKEK
jgi:hypothetical protein